MTKATSAAKDQMIPDIPEVDFEGRLGMSDGLNSPENL
jgi:hypothetical protein